MNKLISWLVIILFILLALKWIIIQIKIKIEAFFQNTIEPIINFFSENSLFILIIAFFTLIIIIWFIFKSEPNYDYSHHFQESSQNFFDQNERQNQDNESASDYMNKERTKNLSIFEVSSRELIFNILTVENFLEIYENYKERELEKRNLITKKEIYRKLSILIHPDKSHGIKEKIRTEAFQKLNNLYNDCKT